jgi:hypothetical protein
MQSQDGSADLTHAEWLGLLIDRETATQSDPIEHAAL